MGINITGQEAISFAQSLWVLALHLITELAKKASSFLSWTISTLSSALEDNATVTLFIISAFIGIITWFLNERAKRSNEIHLRKVERYVELIDLIEILMGSENKKPGDEDLRAKFMHQINLCWLYCSDDVVRKTFDLVSKFNDDGIPPEEKEETLSKLMITLRKDVLRMPTKLNNADYKSLRPAMLRHFVFNAKSVAVGTTGFSMHVNSKEKGTMPPKK